MHVRKKKSGVYVSKTPKKNRLVPPPGTPAPAVHVVVCIGFSLSPHLSGAAANGHKNNEGESFGGSCIYPNAVVSNLGVYTYIRIYVYTPRSIFQTVRAGEEPHYVLLFFFLEKKKNSLYDLGDLVSPPQKIENHVFFKSGRFFLSSFPFSKKMRFSTWNRITYSYFFF